MMRVRDGADRFLRALVNRSLRLPSFVDERRLVWWPNVPRPLRVPAWWRWTIALGDALAADVVASRCMLEGVIALWPPTMRR